MLSLAADNSKIILYTSHFCDMFVWLYLLQCLQGFNVYFSDEVGFCYSVEILTNRVNVHQAVVCDLNALEVGEKPANKNR